jgi:hypothetical protein
VLGADRRALRGLGDDHFSRAQHALQVSRRDQAGPGDTGRPHGIIASTDTWLPTVDHQDPLLWIQKLDDASAGEQGSRSALEGGAQLSERAELTLARASFPPGTTAHALASAGDLRALRRHLHQRALPGAAAARGFSTSARAAQHITHISGSGEELLQLNLPTASPVRSQPLMAVRTSDDTVHDPSDFRPDNLKVLVNPYTDSPLPSISHIAETPLGKDGLGGDMMSEHMVDHSSGKVREGARLPAGWMLQLFVNVPTRGVGEVWQPLRNFAFCSPYRWMTLSVAFCVALRARE